MDCKNKLLWSKHYCHKCEFFKECTSGLKLNYGLTK